VFEKNEKERLMQLQTCFVGAMMLTVLTSGCGTTATLPDAGQQRDGAVVCAGNEVNHSGQCACRVGYVRSSLGNACRPKLGCSLEPAGAGEFGAFNISFPSLKQARVGHCAVYLAEVDKLYVIGGRDTRGTLLDSVEVIDVSTGTRSDGGSLLYPIDNHTCFAYNGEIVVAGGRAEFVPSVLESYVGWVSVFNPQSNLWRKVGRLPEPRGRAGFTRDSQGRPFLAGGRKNTDAISYLRSVVAFEGEGVWKHFTNDLPDTGSNMVAFTHQGSTYVVGGERYENNVYTPLTMTLQLVGEKWKVLDDTSLSPRGPMSATDRFGDAWAFSYGIIARFDPQRSSGEWFNPLARFPMRGADCNIYVNTGVGFVYLPADDMFVATGGQCDGLGLRPVKDVITGYCPDRS
jgi:hypothetical protein